jgi:drug/metabolite transporter (DMT)-like permease
MMSVADCSKLMLLGAIWGGSFIFMRVLSPALGPLATADLRVLIAGFCLLGYYRVRGRPIVVKRDFGHFLFISIINAVLPFVLFAYAALSLPAGYSAIINSTSPVFSALFATTMHRAPFTWRQTLGFLLGVTGVSLITHVGVDTLGVGSLTAILACVVASACYGLAGAYIKKYASHIGPEDLACKSQLYAGLILLPALLYRPPQVAAWTPEVIGCVAGLSLLSSTLAYVLYFPLLKTYGATKALTVTYLVPVFGILWAFLFLHERLSWLMVPGGLLIALGTLLG